MAPAKREELQETIRAYEELIRELGERLKTLQEKMNAGKQERLNIEVSMSTETGENRLAADSVVTAMAKADELGLALARPFSQKILVLETPVARIFHVKGIHRLIRKPKKGDLLALVREPKNAYDELAVLVRNAEGKKLGYIPRAKNEVLANLMDAGKCFEAEVLWTRDKKEPGSTIFEETQIWLRVYMVE